MLHATHRVEVEDDVDFLTAEGWVAVTLDGIPTGFEVFSDSIDDETRSRYRARLKRNNESPDQFLHILETSDFDLNFNCKNSQLEIEAARIVMNVIAKSAKGWISDPQIGKMVRLGIEGT